MEEITLQIVLSAPPTGVGFCIQEGHGHDVSLYQRQVSETDPLIFNLPVKLKTAKTGEPDFGGPFVQGPAGGRFVYINVGTSAGDLNSPWQRRMKIPLSGISKEMIGQIEMDKSRYLKTTVPGTGKDGTPNCATIKPFSGWRPA